MTHLIRTVEAVYEQGYLRPLEPIEQRQGLVYIVTIVDLKAVDRHIPSIKALRGKYRGHLSSSSDFARNKANEKGLER
jgi:predicted DNA-binding antitoxin AbrB/MazE fold protein